MKKRFIFSFYLLFIFKIYSQISSFDIKLEALTIPELGGLQSFAFGQYDGKWLIIGGRLDGLHRRQPFASFDKAGHNNRMYVIDPIKKKNWSAPLTSLPNSMQEQLKSTNMEFYQAGKFLYLIGGYGFSESIGDHTTFSNLVAINVEETINAIINSTNFEFNFRQITDTIFQVTGGRLEKIYDSYYLVGGQKFIGRYNPMGPNHGPGFVQEYTNQIRKFDLIDDGKNLLVKNLKVFTDTVNLHRRDYNVSPQILPSGEEGLIAFSGVFQKNINLPYLNCVIIDSSGYKVNDAFSQYYNHYHCANLPIYSQKTKEMSTVFFGGIAQYFDSSGLLTQNNDVPFVKTIARVSSDAKGTMTEYKLPSEMPSLLGAGSEFIRNENLPIYANGVIKYDDLSSDTSFIGYIFGGISSSEPNIFFINDGTQSEASKQLFKVYLIKNKNSKSLQINKQSVGTLKVMVIPNVNEGEIEISYNLVKPSDVKISIFSDKGKLIKTQIFKNQSMGNKKYNEKIKKIKKGGVFKIYVETNDEKISQLIVIEL